MILRLIIWWFVGSGKWTVQIKSLGMRIRCWFTVHTQRRRFGGWWHLGQPSGIALDVEQGHEQRKLLARAPILIIRLIELLLARALFNLKLFLFHLLLIPDRLKLFKLLTVLHDLLQLVKLSLMVFWDFVAVIGEIKFGFAVVFYRSHISILLCFVFKIIKIIKKIYYIQSGPN